jgi:hypothetical protein
VDELANRNLFARDINNRNVVVDCIFVTAATSVYKFELNCGYFSTMQCKLCKFLIQSHLCTIIARCDFPGAPRATKRLAVQFLGFRQLSRVKRRDCPEFSTLCSGGPLADDRHSVPPAFYKLPRGAPADMASRTRAVRGNGQVLVQSAGVMLTLWMRCLSQTAKCGHQSPVFGSWWRTCTKLGYFLGQACFQS